MVSLADAETALGEVRLASELDRTIVQLNHAAEHADQRRAAATSQERVMTPGGEILLTTSPVGIGVVASFAASNFPFGFGVLGTDTASAIAAGCPVVIKAHPAQPETSSALAVVLNEAIAKSGLDPSVAAVVHGFDAGRALVRSPHISAVTFTGSRRAAGALTAEISTRVTPVPFFGELGSVNPVIVSDACVRARGEAFAAGLFESFTLGNGQFCTKPGIVVASPWAVDQLWAALRSLVERHQGGWMLTQSIADAYRTSLREVRRHCTEFAVGGLPAVSFAAQAALGRTDADGWRNEATLRDAHFGPLLLLVAVTNDDQRAAILPRRGRHVGYVHPL